MDALELYELLYYLHRQTTWGDHPVPRAWNREALILTLCAN